MFCVLELFKNPPKKSSPELFFPPPVKDVTALEDNSLTNTKIYFNPNCILQLIIDYLCLETQIQIDGDAYDLCTATGDLLLIKDYKATVSGLTIFHPKETYYIVNIIRNETKSVIEEMNPVLKPNTKLYDTLLKNLKMKQIKRRSSTSKKRGNSSKHTLSVSLSSNLTLKSKRISSANI